MIALSLLAALLRTSFFFSKRKKIFLHLLLLITIMNNAEHIFDILNELINRTLESTY